MIFFLFFLYFIVELIKKRAISVPLPETEEQFATLETRGENASTRTHTQYTRQKEKCGKRELAMANITCSFHLLSISKSRTRSLVSSVPLRLPTAQTSRVSSARILHTTPPLPPLSKETKLRMNSPVSTK